FAVILAGFSAAFGQNEQSPIVEKEIAYKDWTYKSISTGAETNLRDLTKGKKLVMVVYFAPWCPNWRHDAPMVERLYEKYKNSGLGVVAVGEYDPIASMKNNLDFLKITFPAVYESEARTDRQKTAHYDYRKLTGDTRGWGSPWYIFLEPDKLEKKGDVLTAKANVVNGELIETEGEKFIREKLGVMTESSTNMTAQSGKIEVCDPAKPAVQLKKTNK
ncbi:MAG TPA: TlpA disulfide reductase family protein, partial [Pyrinomonadaceae bacterium]|nr:TlpA disulfide reductase family protein [Pyrinomonadaceae bacterium]